MRSANRTEAALKRGCDDLQSTLEWLLRDRPRALANAKRKYVNNCVSLHRLVEHAAKVPHSKGLK
jgi:hypothetical protein